MECVREAHDLLAAGDLPSQLQGGLYRVRAGRPGKLHAIAEATRFEDHGAQSLQELRLCHGVHVETVQHPVLGQVVEQRPLEHRMVVPVVESTGSAEEV